jgi:8-oxo-dGTP pyrophosphatase MutT (NUDIX family)
MSELYEAIGSPRGLREVGEGDYAIHTNVSGEKFWGNQGAGVLPICTTTGRILVGLRSRYVNEPNTWGLFGGAIDEAEQPARAAKRELAEELGYRGAIKLLPAYVFTSPGGGFKFFNFLGLVTDEFKARLDWETSRTQWLTWEGLQALSPKHFGLKGLLQHNGREIQRYAQTKTEALTEQWARVKALFPGVRSPLFHKTSYAAAAGVVLRGEGIVSAGPPPRKVYRKDDLGRDIPSEWSWVGRGISLTRSFDWAVSAHVPGGVAGGAILVLERSDLPQRLLVPWSFFGARGKHTMNEYEERFMGRRIPLAKIRGALFAFPLRPQVLRSWADAPLPVVHWTTTGWTPVRPGTPADSALWVPQPYRSLAAATDRSDNRAPSIEEGTMSEVFNLYEHVGRPRGAGRKSWYLNEDRKSVGGKLLSQSYKMNVATISETAAVSFARQHFEEAGVDLDKEIPGFESNFKLLKSKMSKALGVKRIDMPVIEPEDIAQFNQDLDQGRVDIFKPTAWSGKFPVQFPRDMSKAEGEEWIELGLKDGDPKDDVIRGKLGKVPVKNLLPLQSQIWFEKLIGSLLKWGKPGGSSPVLSKTIIVSKEGYILDGHHRFGQAMLADPGLQMAALTLPLDVKLLLDLTRSYGAAIGRKAKA